MMKNIFTIVVVFFFYSISLGQPKQIMVKMVNGKPQLVKINNKPIVPILPKTNQKFVKNSQSIPYPARTQKATGGTTNIAPPNSLLVKDINPNTIDVFSHADPALHYIINNNPTYPDTGVSLLGGPLFFPAYNYNGVELWQTDGTDAGTGIVKDIDNIFGAYHDANPMFLQAMGSDLYFFTAEFNGNNFYNYRLRKRDGGTNMINEGSLTDYPFDYVSNVIQANGYLFFFAVNSNMGEYNYYNTNGDTALVRYDPSNNQYSLVNTYNPREMYVFGDYLIFDADDGNSGREPWKYDINNDYAELLFDVNQNENGAASSNPHDFIGYHNTLFYTADDGNGNGRQLKTALLENSTFSSFSGVDLQFDANPKNKIVFNDQLYFRLNATNSSFDIYKLNGDYPAFSTSFVATDVNSSNGAMVVVNNHLLFAADDNNNHNQLWQTDANDNTSRVGDANINDYDDANPSNFIVVNNKLLFVANDGGAARNIWQTDGNSASKVIETPTVSHGFYDPTIFGVNNDFAYFFMDDGTNGRELWKTDGTAANTTLVSDINKGDNTSIGSNIVGMEMFKGQLYFGANTGNGHVSMYKTDGTPAGTVEAFAGNSVVDHGGFNYMYYSQSQIKAVGNTLFFTAYNNNGYELWKTDGTAAGTVLVKDINTKISTYNPGYTEDSYPDNFTALNGKLYFTAEDGTHNRQLYVSDGTVAGTIMLTNVNASGFPNVGNLTADTTNNKLYFSVDDGVHGNELWVTNGTAAGTVMLKDINDFGNSSSNPGGFSIFNNKLYFGAIDSVHGSEPWVSDGTAAGTTVLKDINIGAGSSNGGFQFAQLGSYLYFGADVTNQSSHLWRTDGTTAGTQKFNNTVDPQFLFNIANIGNKIAFIAGGPIGFSMYTTDGTDAGTIKVTDFGSIGTGSFLYGNYVSFKNHYFTWISDNVHGNEMWQTDGTVAGTFITDIANGELSSYPTAAKGSAGPLLFAANDGSYAGNELWRLNVSASVTWLSFTATKNTDSTVLLNWATASETDNKGFIIQHSVDNIHFDSLGFVAAASPNGANYSFHDDHPISGVNYYRLAQKATNGTIEYSNVEQIFIYAPLKGGLIKSSETLCIGILPSKIVDSIAVTGGQSTGYTYQWQDSLATKHWRNIPDSIFATYQPQILNITTYFRRIVYAGIDSAVSNIITKTYSVPPGDTTVAPTTAWNVYVYGGTDISLASPANSPYYGYYSDAALNFNSQTYWSNLSNPTAASNFQGCPLPPSVVSSYGTFYQFTVALKRKSFTPGNYVLNLAGYTGSMRILVNGVQFYNENIGFNPYSSTRSNPTVSLGALDANSIVEIRMVSYPAYTYQALLNFSLYQSNLQPGAVLTYNPNTCPNVAPAQLYSSALAFGGPAPLNITYQWQSSLKTPTNFQNITGATTINYNPPILADTTYFRRVASDGQSSVYSDTLAINVNPVKDIPTLTKVGRVLYANLVPGVYNVKWFRNGVQISGVSGASYTAVLAGSYTTKYQEYCGDGPSSNAIVFANDAQPQTINFTQPASIIYGTSAFIKLGGTATSGLGIQYNINYGPARISNDTLYITGTGNVSITAAQPGNDNFTPATSITQIFIVTPGSQTIAFSAIPNKKYGDAPFAITATSSAGLGVSYSIISGPAYVYGNTVTLTGAGTITVKASQQGNGNYNAAADATQTFCVGINQISAIKGDTLVCPSTYKYAVDSITGANYEWGVSGAGTVVMKGDTAIVTWQAAGDYILYAKGYSGCDAVRSTTSTLVVHVATVVVPTAVTNMFPADGTQNLQLPLTLSWIPGANSNSYDLYVWNASSAKPATPYANNITGVNYTLPNVGFAYNTTYKWSITSRNPCSQVVGPTQTFSLIPLPDLLVSNVVAPATAFSGQNISITWKVTNNGPGRTNLNQRWSDAVFLSFDDHPTFVAAPQTNPASWSAVDFPIRPLLLGVLGNVSALENGESYTNSLNFTLPLKYNFPVYVYVITNYAPGSTAPQEVTLLNDTAHAPSPTIVALSPTPDLRVDSVITPTEIFSGSTINVTYKIKNYGALTPVGNNWTDKVYISKDPLFDAATAIPLNAPKSNGTYYYNAPLAEFGHSGQLQQDSFYTKAVSVVVPNFIQGSYYIYVMTDAKNTVYEGSLDNNNVGANLVTVYLTPTPTLTVASLSAPTTASITQPLNINWSLKNTGYYDNLQKNQGHYLGITNHCATCYVPYCPPPPPQNPCNNCVIVPYVCPSPRTGYNVIDSVGFGSSNWKDNVYLSTDPSGLNVSNAILLGNFAHSNPNETNYDFDGATSLPHLQYNGTLFQAGQPYFGLYLYYGSGIPDGANPRSYDVNTTNAISQNAVIPGALNFVLPDNLPQGTYYAYVYANADNGVYEYPDQMQVRRSDAIVVNRPDISVAAISSPATAVSGKPITITYQVTNAGPGGVFNHNRTDYIYVSTSPVFDANAQIFGTPSYNENLPINVPVSHSITYNVPVDASGMRYFYVRVNVDSSFRENNYVNNLSTTPASTNVTLAPTPNLLVSNITVPNTVSTVIGFPFSYTVPNNGPGTTTGTWTDSIFVSCSPTFDATTAYGVGVRTHNNSVPSGGSYTDSFNLSIPFTADINSCFGSNNPTSGYFYVKTNANRGVYEGSSTSDNVLGTGIKTIINPFVDQIVTSVVGMGNATVGRNYSTTWTVKNIGQNPGYNNYNNWTDALYFSTDSVFNGNAVPAGYYGGNTPLNTNQTYTSTNANFITPNIVSGDYYVFINTNNYNQIHGEINLSNNNNLIRDVNGKAQKIHVTLPPLPDLTDTILVAQATVATGQPLTLSYQVSNKGSGVTYPSTWSDGFWLSSDFIPGNEGDYYLGSFNHSGALQVSQSYTDTVSLPISMNVTPGNYVLISKTNLASGVFETNLNNNLAFRYVTVFSPPPTDLIVTNIIRPDTVYLGDADSTTWSLSNISANPANGIETDGLYLSKTITLDSSAVLLGTIQNKLAMLPLTLDTIKLAPIVQGITEGQYYLIVKTDILNNIVETNKNNNTGVSATPIYVKVRPLPLNVLTAGTLKNLPLYYKLTIPNSLDGATILLTLKSKDSLTTNNQLYVGKGYVPTAAHFDYAFDKPNYGNQQILMPSVSDTDYYVTVNCTTINPPTQSITLLAVNLPFAIVSIDAKEGGNSGNVTIKITGSLFTTDMLAVLRGTSVNVTATKLYYINSTTAYATFNLQGVPLGKYDLTLTKTDATNTTLSQGFTVVNPNNGGLITGGGINTGPTNNGNSPGCDPGAPSGLNAQLQTQIIIPPKVFGGRAFTITINFSNPTNVDISTQTRVLYSLDNIPISLTQDGLADGKTSLYIQFSEQNGPPGIIRAGGTGTVTIYSKTPANYPGHTDIHYNLK